MWHSWLILNLHEYSFKFYTNIDHVSFFVLLRIIVFISVVDVTFIALLFTCAVLVVSVSLSHFLLCV